MFKQVSDQGSSADIDAIYRDNFNVQLRSNKQLVLIRLLILMKFI